MKSFFAVFANECRAVLRSRTLYILLVLSVAWMIAAPRFFTSDGTVEGLRQMSLHYSLGGVTAMLAIALMVAATGSIARERAAKRLALTMVRPVRYFSIAFGKMLAFVVCGAFILAISTGIEYFRSPDTPCRHVLRPVMPSIYEEAEMMYPRFMANSNTPAQVKAAKKDVIIRILANRAIDRYDTVPTNSVFTWDFDTSVLSDPLASSLFPAVRLKFSTMFDQRDDVYGELGLGNYSGVVTNISQAVIEVPLSNVQTAKQPNGQTLSFTNKGRNQVMLRPRRDVELLLPADSFGRNLLRAYLELVSMLALLVAFGVFLGSALGRPPALFTAIAVLLLSEMAPSVIDSYTDELESNKADAFGLAITRASVYVTRPVSSLRPLEALSLDECIEPREVVRVLATDLVLLPVLLAFLSAIILPRKQDF